VIESRRMIWPRHITRMVEGRDVYGVLVGKPEGKEAAGRPRRRWEKDNIKNGPLRSGIGARPLLIWFRIGTGDKSSGSVTSGQLLDYLRNFKLASKDSAR
jgi:hypothetical protein